MTISVKTDALAVCQSLNIQTCFNTAGQSFQTGHLRKFTRSWVCVMRRKTAHKPVCDIVVTNRMSNCMKGLPEERLFFLKQIWQHGLGVQTCKMFANLEMFVHNKQCQPNQTQHISSSYQLLSAVVDG